MPLELKGTLDDGQTSRYVELRGVSDLCQVSPHAHRFMSFEVVAPEPFETEKTSICSHVRDNMNSDVPLEGVDADESLPAEVTLVVLG